MILVCPKCRNQIASFNPADISRPIEADMFQPPRPNFPQPFPAFNPGQRIDWKDMACPYCDNPPFNHWHDAEDYMNGPHELMTTKGPWVIGTNPNGPQVIREVPSQEELEAEWNQATGQAKEEEDIDTDVYPPPPRDQIMDKDDDPEEKRLQDIVRLREKDRLSWRKIGDEVGLSSEGARKAYLKHNG